MNKDIVFVAKIGKLKETKDKKFIVEDLKEDKYALVKIYYDAQIDNYYIGLLNGEIYFLPTGKIEKSYLKYLELNETLVISKIIPLELLYNEQEVSNLSLKELNKKINEDKKEFSDYTKIFSKRITKMIKSSDENNKIYF